MRQKCESCEWWLHTDNILVDGDWVPMGDCHRFPPVFVFDTTEDDFPPDAYSFPSTWEYQWCGEFKQRTA